MPTPGTPYQDAAKQQTDALQRRFDLLTEQQKIRQEMGQMVAQGMQDLQAAQANAQFAEVAAQLTGAAQAKDNLLKAKQEEQAEGQSPPTPPASPRIDPNKLGVGADTSSAQNIFETVVGGAGVQQGGKGNIGGYGEPGELVTIQEQYGPPNLVDAIRGRGRSLYNTQVTRRPDVLTAANRANIMSNAQAIASRERLAQASAQAAQRENYLTQLAPAFAGAVRSGDPEAMDYWKQYLGGLEQRFPGISNEITLLGVGKAQWADAAEEDRRRRKLLGGGGSGGGGQGTEYERAVARMDAAIEAGDQAAAEFEANRANSILGPRQGMVKVTRTPDGKLTRTLDPTTLDPTDFETKTSITASQQLNSADTAIALIDAFRDSKLKGGLTGAVEADVKRGVLLLREGLSITPAAREMYESTKNWLRSGAHQISESEYQPYLNQIDRAMAGEIADPKGLINLFENTLAYMLVQARKPDRANIEDLRRATIDTQIQSWLVPGASTDERLNLIEKLFEQAVEPYRDLVANHPKIKRLGKNPRETGVFRQAFGIPKKVDTSTPTAPGSPATVTFDSQGNPVVR